MSSSSIDTNASPKLIPKSNWVPNTDKCQRCHEKFTFRKRAHHCRNCGLVVCKKCSLHKVPFSGVLLRVCNNCYNDGAILILTEQQIKQQQEQAKLENRKPPIMIQTSNIDEPTGL